MKHSIWDYVKRYLKVQDVDTQTDMHTDAHINTMTRPGLEDGPSEYSPVVPSMVKFLKVKKLDGVGPVDNRPPPTSFTTLSNRKSSFFQQNCRNS